MIAYQFKKPGRPAAKLLQAVPILFAVFFGAAGGYLLLATHAATTLQPSVSWSRSGSELLNQNASLCLGTPGSTQAAIGATVVVEGCSATSSQNWTLTWGGSTVKSGTVVNGYKQCLDDRGGNAGVGTTVKIYTCTANDPSQVWTNGYGDGTIRIDGLCLGVSGNSRAAGTAAILTPCNTPVPSVHLTSPASGSKVSGTTTVAASATIAQDSIAKITLQAGSTVLATCMNTSSCTANWNTASVGNGSYTLTAVATGSLGGTATASESVQTSNASPPPSGGSSGGGSGSTSSEGGNSSSGGSSSASTPTTDSGTFTCDPSDPTCSDSTVSVCDPSDPTCSDSPSLCDASDPSCGSATSGTSNDTGSGSSSTGSSTQGGSQSSKNSTAKKLSPGKRSVASIVAIIFLLLLIIGAVVFLYLRKRRQSGNQPVYNSNDFFNEIAAPVEDTPAPLPTALPHTAPVVTEHSVADVSLPAEGAADAEARLRWWDTNAGHHPVQPASHDKAIDEPPDMFERGRKRLEEEDNEGPPRP